MKATRDYGTIIKREKNIIIIIVHKIHNRKHKFVVYRVYKANCKHNKWNSKHNTRMLRNKINVTLIDNNVSACAHR